MIGVTWQNSLNVAHLFKNVRVIDISNRRTCYSKSPKILALSIYQSWQCLGALTRQEAMELCVGVAGTAAPCGLSSWELKGMAWPVGLGPG